MGIRFFCPNGHRLNVKSHLAGKRGYCPHCGVKLLIPQESDVAPIGLPPAVEENVGAGAPEVQPEAQAVPPAMSQMTAPAGQNKEDGKEFKNGENGGHEASSASDLEPSDSSRELSNLGTSANAVSERSSPVTAPDGSTAAPANGGAWYVRPPSGGQFGPATFKLLTQWVEDRRVPAESLIWCEGWSDWKVASEYFSTAPTGDSPVIGAAFHEIDEIDFELPAQRTDEPTDFSGIERRDALPVATKRKQTRLFVATSLAVITVLLLVALALVVSF